MLKGYFGCSNPIYGDWRNTGTGSGQTPLFRTRVTFITEFRPVSNFRILGRPCRRQQGFELSLHPFKRGAQLDDDGTVREARAVHVVR